MGSRGFDCLICNELGAAMGGRDVMPLSHCCFSDPSLISQLPGREVPCGTCDCLGTISRVCISSPNVVGDGVAAVLSV